MAHGDMDKAMKAVYEVVMGEGAGAGREAKKLLPLGNDMKTRLQRVHDYLAHSLDVFGDITDSVALDT